jgi:hypothetical protein
MGWEEIAAGGASGLVQGGMNLLGTHLQNKANAKMNRENMRLAYITRGDTLKQQGFDNRLAQQDRAFRADEAAYAKRQDRRAAMRLRIQDDAALRNDFLNALQIARGR